MAVGRKIKVIVYTLSPLKIENQRNEEYCMMIYSNDLLIGYDYDAWYGYGEKVPIYVDATKHNSHTLICGISGSGKSYLTNQYLARFF